METAWHTSDSSLNDLWNKVTACAARDYGSQELDGQTVFMGPPWLRDHVHEMKAYKYLVKDMTTGLEFFFRHQLPDGQFPDFFVPIGDQHQSFVHPDWELEDHTENRVFIRIPVETDLEYLAVEGVYQTWKASGDCDWTDAQLPALYRGLEHLTTNRYRWNREYGLVQRPFTIDTWDFTGFYDPNDDFKINCEIRRLDDTTPLCLFHGDNSGLYSACWMLAEMLTALGRDTEASRWMDFGEALRARANRLLWGDGFYIHQLHLDLELARKHDERNRLSLSNPYDINRGMPDHAMAVAIIDSYRKRFEEKQDQYVAEWFTIDPPYEPRFSWFEPGRYVNGGLFPTVGGELAKASFNHGREEYAVDLLRRYHQFVVEKNECGFIYWPDGRGYGGGPSGWCAAAFVSAMMEGLAGIEDRATRFDDILLSPRWAAGAVESAQITAHYPASDALFSYQYLSNEKEIRLECDGTGKHLKIHLLLPEGFMPSQVQWNGQAVLHNISAVESSRYLDAEVQKQKGVLLIDGTPQ